MDVTQLRVDKPGCLPVCCLLSAKCWIHYITVIVFNRAPFYSLFRLFFLIIWIFFPTNVSYYSSYLLCYLFYCSMQVCSITAVRSGCLDRRLKALVTYATPTCSTLMSNSPWTFLPLKTFTLHVKWGFESNCCSPPDTIVISCKIAAPPPSIAGLQKYSWLMQVWCQIHDRSCHLWKKIL